MATKKSPKTEFKQVRRMVKNNQAVALEKACTSLDCKPEDLVTAHTETTFVFKLKVTKTDNGQGTKELLQNYPFGIFSVEKTKDDNDLKNAVKKAMEYFGTFEANIKRVEKEEDETHFVFTKVRG